MIGNSMFECRLTALLPVKCSIHSPFLGSTILFQMNDNVVSEWEKVDEVSELHVEVDCVAFAVATTGVAASVGWLSIKAGDFLNPDILGAWMLKRNEGWHAGETMLELWLILIWFWCWMMLVLRIIERKQLRHLVAKRILSWICGGVTR